MSNFTQLDLDDQLIDAIYDIDCERIIECIQKGANVNQLDRNNFSALHVFCHSGNIEGVKLCISKNININQKVKKFKFTPLIFAVRNNHYEICKLLLQKGAYPTIKNETGKTALDYAKENNNQKIIKLIKSYLSKNDILMTNFKQNELDDQLKNAISKCDYIIIIRSIQKGANVNQIDLGGYTPLHIFCNYENIEGVKLCISKNANVNVQAEFSKSTPLNFAVFSDNYEICKTLLEAGADPTIKDSNENDALWYAKKNNNQKIIDLIKSYLLKKN